MSFREKYLKLRSNLANYAIWNIFQDFSIMNVFLYLKNVKAVFMFENCIKSENIWNLTRSTLIKNVNLSKLEELNTVWACILYKGHWKDKESDRSYRTISTCPILAKALDVYVGQLYGDD